MSCTCVGGSCCEPCCWPLYSPAYPPCLRSPLRTLKLSERPLGDAAEQRLAPQEAQSHPRLLWNPRQRRLEAAPIVRGAMISKCRLPQLRAGGSPTTLPDMCPSSSQEHCQEQQALAGVPVLLVGQAALSLLAWPATLRELVLLGLPLKVLGVLPG